MTVLGGGEEVTLEGGAQSAANASRVTPVQLSPFGEAAVSYAERDWSVVPLWSAVDGDCTCPQRSTTRGEDGRCRSPGKHPIAQRGVHDATTDSETIRAWWTRHPHANIGVATGDRSGIVVLDVDPRNGGSDTFEALERQFGALPETVTCDTGGGGAHYYFRAPTDETLISKLGPGIDVKFRDGYVVAPPSLHQSGEDYGWRSESAPEEVELSPLPKRWLEALRPLEREDASAVPMPDCDVTIDVRENRARRYVEKMPPAISGNGGHGALWSVAVVVARGFMLPPNRAMAVLCDYNVRCQPPWSDKELAHKLRDAERAHLDWGYLLRAKRAGASGAQANEGGNTQIFDRAPTSDELEGLGAAGVSVVQFVTSQEYQPASSTLTALRDQGFDVYVDDQAACIWEAEQIIKKAGESDRGRTEALRHIQALLGSLSREESAAHGDRIVSLAAKGFDVPKSSLRAGVRGNGDSELDAHEWARGLVKRNGVIDSTPGNAAIILTNDSDWKDTLSLDEFASCISFVRQPAVVQGLPVIEPGELLDVHAVPVQQGLLRRYRTLFSKETIFSAIEAAAFANRRHPVREYFDRCADAWDGEERLNDWVSDYLGVVKTLFTMAAGRAWLISGVARIYEPGCQADHVFVLQGGQGKKKSQALRALVPDATWFIDHLGAAELRSKDARASLRGVFLVELAELAALSRNEVEAVKAFITTARDRFRPAYGRVERTYPRQCIFAGTTNAEAFLKDSTGNRRFWPVKVGEINLAALAAARDQLWGEAVHRFRAREPWWLNDPEVIGLAEDEQEARRETDPWQEAIETHVARRQCVTTAALLEQAIKVELHKRTKADEMRVASVLQALGWTRQRESTADWRARRQRGEGRSTREMYWLPPKEDQR